MREKTLGIARRAAIDHADVLFEDTCVFELAPVRRDQVEMNFGAEVAMAGGALVQKQHWIFDVNGIGVECLFEQIVGVSKLRRELGTNLLSDRIAAFANARSNRRPQIAGHAAELSAHLAHTFFYNARRSPAPASVKCSDYAALYIGDEYGHAVGGLDGKQYFWGIGDDAVTRRRLLGKDVDPVHNCGVNLPYLYQRPQTTIGVDGADGLREQLAIPFDVGLGIVFGDAEIQRLPSIASRNTARAGAAAMDQPRDASKHFGSQDLNRFGG
jgi:hypothetical protein